jgi:hypothetical protein
MQTTSVPKFLRRMSYLSLALTAFLLGLIFYWMLKPYDPITFERDIFKVHKTQVKQGDYLSYELKYCKDNELTPVVETSFVDGIIYKTPKSPQPFLEEGCHTKVFLIYIPKALPESEYILTHTYEFKVNPIRTVTVKAITESFEVAK